MSNIRPMLAVITARGGSKGLPGKNVRPFAGLPLIAHSLRFAALTPSIDRCIVSTDSPEIAAVAREYGGETPFLRPAALAADDTPSLPVLKHALQEMERLENRRYESVLLLDPTSPGRLPEDLERAVAMLESDPQAVGVVAVSEPRFNPRWVCVEEQDGYLAMAFAAGKTYTRRQDVPPVYRINAALYLWRRDYLLDAADGAWDKTPHRLLVIPEERAFHIDTRTDFELAEMAVAKGMVNLPWLEVVDGPRP